MRPEPHRKAHTWRQMLCSCQFEILNNFLFYFKWSSMNNKFLAVCFLTLTSKHCSMCNPGSWVQCRNIKVEALSIYLPAEWNSGCLWGPTIAHDYSHGQGSARLNSKYKNIRRAQKRKKLLFPFKESLFIIIIF